MGCTTSTTSSKATTTTQPEVTVVERIEIATWATKTEGDLSKPQRFAPREEDDDDMLHKGNFLTKPSVSKSNAPSRGRPGGLREERAASPLVLVDTEDEDVEIEIIHEELSRHHKGELGGSGIGSPASQAPIDQFPTKPVVFENALSQRQKEEAAKLAEQRKRFDKRYKGDNSFLQSPKFTGPYPVVAERSTAKEPPTPLVLGLTESACAQDLETEDFENYLPGGIDTPRSQEESKINLRVAETMTKNRDKHEVFNDDEELLMQEILESASVKS